jgi:hypothetical protein
MTLGSGTDVNLTETPFDVEMNVPDQPAAAMSGAKAKVAGDWAKSESENEIRG